MKKEKTQAGILAIRIIIGIIILVTLGSGYYIFRLFAHVNPKNEQAMKIRQNFKFDWNDRINILLIGGDGRKNINIGTRSDTLILVNLDLKNKNIRYMSIPRDTWVEVPGHSFTKINATINEAYYNDGGVGLTVKTVEKLIKMDVKLYISINFEAFKKVVDTVGGIELNVEKDMYYYDPTDGTIINLKKGMQTLDGDKALQYVRFRNDEQGDFAVDSEGHLYGRVARQVHFVRALARRLSKTRNLLTISQAINSALQYTDTNLDFSELIKLAYQFRDIDVEVNLKAVTFPGYPTMLDGISIVQPEQEKLDALVQTEFREPQT